MLLCRKFNLALKKDVCYLNPDPRPPPFRFCQCSYCKQQAGGLGPGKKPVLLLLLNCFALFILGTFGLCCQGNSLCCQGNSTTFMWKFTLWWLILWRINKIIKHSCKEFIYSTLYIYIAPSLGRTFERCSYIWCCLGNGLYIQRSLINLNYVLIIKFVLHCWFGLCKCLQCHKFRSN